MEKILAKIASFLLHPLLMTSLGLLVLFHSDTPLSVLVPEVKRITLIVTVLFTLLFPASMIIMLFLTRTISNIDFYERKERVLPVTLTIIMYLFTFFIIKRIPQLTGVHIVYLFCPSVILFVLLLLNNFIKPSIHMAGVGLLIALFLVLILYYGAKIQLLFMISVLVAGFLGTARLILNIHKPAEVLAGFGSGFLVTLLILFLYLI